MTLYVFFLLAHLFDLSDIFVSRVHGGSICQNLFIEMHILVILDAQLQSVSTVFRD